jgi:hypothetical protein
LLTTPLEKFPLKRTNISQRIAYTVPSKHVPEDIDYPMERAGTRGYWITPRDIFKKITQFESKAHHFAISEEINI